MTDTLRAVKTINELVDDIRRTEGCVVQPPRGVPSVRPGEALGRELEEFYRTCGGLSLFAASEYGVEIAGPESFSRANLEIVGREVPDDLTDSWYVLARAASGERLTIDCHPARVGRCHDSFWDSHGVRGSCPIIALSLAELLSRLLAARGKHWYWLEDDWHGHGDAYAARPVEGEGLAMGEDDECGVRREQS
jgi:hypothetical protein